MKDIKIKIKDSTLKNVLNYSSQKNKSPDSSINEIIDFFFNQEDLYSDFVIDESKEIFILPKGRSTRRRGIDLLWWGRSARCRYPDWSLLWRRLETH